MPIGKSLFKINKQLKNKRGSIHPRGRKAQLIARASLRDERVNKTKLIHSIKKSHENQITDFLHEFVELEENKDNDVYTVEKMKELILLFINRDKEELDLLISERRPGRPCSKRQEVLEMRLKDELHLLETGWEVPDLTDIINVKMFKAWKGGHGGLTSIKYKVIKNAEEDKAEKMDEKMT